MSENGQFMKTADQLPAEPAIPHVLHEGRYRLYEKADGGLHLVYLVDGQEIEQHMEIPGAMLRLARMASEGNMSFPQFVKEAAKMRRELYRTRLSFNYCKDRPNGIECRQLY